MKPFMGTLLFSLPVAALATGPFDGTWVQDMASSRTEGTPDSYLVKDGKYTCNTCYPGLTISADGKMHKVTGHSYYDEASATIVSPQTVKVVTTLNGKPALQRSQTVSADGKTLTEEFVNRLGSTPGKGTWVYKRVKDGPPGAHVLSGAWMNDAAASTMSSELSTATVLETADGLKVSYPNGQGYEAKFDGKEYPLINDDSHTMVTVEKLGPRKIRETDKRGGKVASIVTYEVSADGKTIHIVDRGVLTGQIYEWDAKKQ